MGDQLTAEEALRNRATLFSLPNMMSLSRGPLALLLLFESVPIRFVAILLAMLSDGLDGYLARRFRRTSELGGFIDPLMDKFFVLTAVIILFAEQKIGLTDSVFFLLRDIFLVVVVLSLTLTGRWRSQTCLPSIWGKITTFCQFCILICLVVDYPVPSSIFLICALTGALACWEVWILTRDQLLKIFQK